MYFQLKWIFQKDTTIAMQENAFVCKMSFCVDLNRLLVSNDWVWDKIDAMFQTELWKKIQKLYKRKSVWKCQ